LKRRKKKRISNIEQGISNHEGKYMHIMREKIKALSLVFVLVLVSSPIYAKQKTTVTRVIDGDVIQIIYGGVEKRVRLIGIDAPESRNSLFPA